MKFSLSKLRDRNGVSIQKPKPITYVSVDITKNVAMAFVNEQPIEVLQVMEFEAHAAGIFLKGVEKAGDNQYRYQEWFLAYPKELA